MKLTKEQRAKFFRGDWPVLAGRGKPPAEVGHHQALSSRLSFTVTSVRLVPGGWRLNYTVHDDREHKFYLMPSKWLEFKTNERGSLDDDLPPEEELGYTKNPKRVHADEAPALRPDLQNVITMRSRLAKAQRTTSEREERAQERSAKEELHRTLEGLTPQARVIFLAKFRQMCEEAAQDDLEEVVGQFEITARTAD